MLVKGEGMNNNAISINNLVFKYGKLRVIDSISLNIPAGTSFGLLGPNGAGKTTLIRLMVGLLKPLSGIIRCLDKTPSPANARQVGYMPQLPALYSELTVTQNLDFFARIYGLKDKRERISRIDEVIKLIDLREKRKTQAMKLSGGMKQRLSMGCAIIHKPPLLFLDEPTVGLDPELRVHFWNYFESLTQAGTTLIISSHTFDDAAHCQNLAFLRLGRVVGVGTPVELCAATGNNNATLESAFLYHIKRDEVRKDAK
jgi:ABC-2 type transport system ATP-binding protein